MTIDRHFCVTVYVTHPLTQKFLMVYHRKLNCWVPPGGHVDPGEIPDHAAMREVFEETGVEVMLQGAKPPTPTCLTTPYGIQRNIIREGEHEHLDFIYWGTPKDPQQALVQNERESMAIGWFRVDQILSPEFKTFESVRHWVTFFQTLVAP